MSVPPPPPGFPGLPQAFPLPPGWTEHRAPGGQSYYYNPSTKESTYVRPLPAFLLPPNFVPAPPVPAKEKPKTKKPVPGTNWLRVTTTAGNVFYTNKELKKSVWTVPEEIKGAVQEMEEAERLAEETAAKEAEERAARNVQEAEVERIRREVEEQIKKRKAEEGDVAEETVVSKKQKVEEEDEDDDDDEEDEEEEDWQKEAAAQLAAEAEEEEKRKEEEARLHKEQEEEELKEKEKAKGMPVLNMPNRVELSLDEGKALFKTLLREKDINPLLPWDTVLPQFVSDPRYVLLPNVSARRDAFDEYCRERIREQREAKVAAEAAALKANTNISLEPGKDKHDNAKEQFEQLLRTEVTSTRTVWNEWRRKWKKDRRFYGWGRDDREREKRFREWLKELGEQKRKAAQKAESDFFALLREKSKVTPSSTWKEVKKGLDRDPRYDAVGSSSLREELFNTYVKTLSSGTKLFDRPTDSTTEIGPSEERKKEKDKDRRERAVRDREAAVRREKGRTEADLARARGALSREEGEREFMSLLTDAIREPTATFDSSLQQLHTDPRFKNSPLPQSVQQRLFSTHVSNLRSKQMSSLYALFSAHVPGLDTKAKDAPFDTFKRSSPATKLGLDKDDEELEHVFEEWQRTRRDEAEKAFQEMLNENAFVEFWGRVQKMSAKEREAEGMTVKVDIDDLIGEDGNAEEVERADLKTLAKNINVSEIERVLKNDKRYAVFDYIPEQREAWIRNHLQKLAAPKLSVHVPQQQSS